MINWINIKKQPPPCNGEKIILHWSSRYVEVRKSYNSDYSHLGNYVTHWAYFNEPEDLETRKEIKFRDIWGISPNATGDLSSEEFVRNLRDEWDRG